MNNCEILLPKDFTQLSVGVYQQLVTSNKNINLPHYNNKTSPPNKFIIPSGTSINIAPLLPSKYWSMEKGDPLAFILEFNQDLPLEGEHPCTIWVKDMATTPCTQNISFNFQLINWNEINGLGRDLDGQALFRLNANGQTFYYKPDSAFICNARFYAVPPAYRDIHAFPTHPDFVIEVSSFSNIPSNELNNQLLKMCRWIRSGVESGVLFDGMRMNIYLFCQTNILVNGRHAQVQGQQLAHNNEIIQTQNDIQQYQNDIAIANINVALQQLEVQRLQQKLQTMNWQQVYFENMIPYPAFQNVSYRTIPLVGIPAPTPNRGLQLIVHCIGFVNGFNIDLSKVWIR
ncbi:hypothetical protein PPL_09386 [Heterostelium album PN500]|uniref:Putative restriction endonuclease domain-containing protein n=1 Tax=Heterostelium pallidum (strain ATCC 26659 / Pp 5 / PN500) TaxID=670386 RepID=D3BLF2_HETP5|nr:hypothetical protein PPL_09386 [Heterostelium album PN500]EFA77886.1 hypothetical protein PPL_09386 [Heterostelium album PN500]|eukprot:XP_020430014.1 hypothetical protein PPL_09386 [Heterostelium album PN500]